jgi:two-component sensor histidine kinase
MLGHEREDVAPGSFGGTRHPARGPAIHEHALAKLRAIGQVEPYEKVYRRGRPARRCSSASSRSTAVRRGDGPRRHGTSPPASAEALRASEEALREAARRKDDFLATLSHELRNPLAAIASAARVIHARCVAGQDVERPIQILERQVRNSARLLEDLLDVSRITRGLLQLKKEPVLLETVIHGAVDSQRALVDAARHRLSITMPHEPVMVDADPTRLEQVFSNLLNNAVKYTPDGGRISLAAERLEGAVFIRVADSGNGIPAGCSRTCSTCSPRKAVPRAIEGRVASGSRSSANSWRCTAERSRLGQRAGQRASSSAAARLVRRTRATATARRPPASGPASGASSSSRTTSTPWAARQYLSSLGHEVTVVHGAAALAAAAAPRRRSSCSTSGSPGWTGTVARRLAGPAAGSPVLVALWVRAGGGPRSLA